MKVCCILYLARQPINTKLVMSTCPTCKTLLVRGGEDWQGEEK